LSSRLFWLLYPVDINGVTDELKGQTQTLIWHIMATWDEKMEAAKKVRDVLGRIHEFYQKRFPDDMTFMNGQRTLIFAPFRFMKLSFDKN
jgi:hypothetical protein